MSDIVKGRNVLVQKEVDSVYYTIGCGIESTFNFNNTIIGKTIRNANSGPFVKRRIRMSDCSGTVSGVTKTSSITKLSVFHFLEDGVRRAEGNYRIIFTDENSDVVVLDIVAIVESIKIGSNVSANSLFDLNFLSTGGFSMSTLVPPSVPGSEVWLEDHWIVVTGDYWIAAATTSVKHAYTLSGIGTTKFLLQVNRSGVQYDIIPSGTPGNRQCIWNTSTLRLEFDSTNVFNAGETVQIIFKTIS
jgi:hypothetical protein